MLTPDEIASHRFLVSLRGYDRDEVTAFLRKVAGEHGRLQQQVSELEQALEEARLSARSLGSPAADGAPSTAVDVPASGTGPAANARDAFAALGEETTRVLVAAEESAQAIREKAEERARLELDNARREARDEVQAARRTASKIVADAERRRSGIAEDIRALESTRDGFLQDLRAAMSNVQGAVRGMQTTSGTTQLEAPQDGPALAEPVSEVDTAEPRPTAAGPEHEPSQDLPTADGRDPAPQPEAVTEQAAPPDLQPAEASGPTPAGTTEPEPAAAPGPEPVAGPDPAPVAESHPVTGAAPADALSAAQVPAVGPDDDAHGDDDVPGQPEGAEPTAGPAVDEPPAADREPSSTSDDQPSSPLEPGDRSASEGVPEAADAPVAAATATDGPATDTTTESVVAGDPLQLRTESLTGVRPGMLRRLKRALQDVQNGVLDRLRQAGGSPDVDAVLPTDDDLSQIGAVGQMFLTAAYRAGLADAGILAEAQLDDEVGDASRVPAASATFRAVLSHEVTSALRATLRAGSEAGEAETSLSERVGEVFRDLKGPVVEQTVDQHLVRVYGFGQLDAWTALGVTGTTWTLGDEPRCPANRCRLNEQEGAVAIGAEYPSGDTVPPAHDGCTCGLAPAR